MLFRTPGYCHSQALPCTSQEIKQGALFSTQYFCQGEGRAWKWGIDWWLIRLGTPPLPHVYRLSTDCNHTWQDLPGFSPYCKQWRTGSGNSLGKKLIHVWIITWDFAGLLTSSHVGICISWWSLLGICVQKDRKICSSLVWSSLRFTANHLCWDSVIMDTLYGNSYLATTCSLFFTLSSLTLFSKYAQPSLWVFQHHYSLIDIIFQNMHKHAHN